MLRIWGNTRAAYNGIQCSAVVGWGAGWFVPRGFSTAGCVEPARMCDAWGLTRAQLTG